MIQDELTRKERYFLADYWNKIPIIEKITFDNSQKSKSFEIRTQIIVAISKGVFDEQINRQRRGLSVNEILKNLEESDIEITKSTLYYHLQKLQETNQIKILMEKKSGKIITSYYGRTAKLHMIHLDSDKSLKDKGKHEKVKKLDILKDLLKKFDNSTINFDEVLSFDLDKQYNEEFFAWIKNNEKNFHHFEEDLLIIARLYNTIKFHKEYGGLLRQLSTTLNIK